MTPGSGSERRGRRRGSLRAPPGGPGRASRTVLRGRRLRKKAQRIQRVVRVLPVWGWTPGPGRCYLKSVFRERRRAAPAIESHHPIPDTKPPTRRAHGERLRSFLLGAPAHWWVEPRAAFRQSCVLRALFAGKLVATSRSSGRPRSIFVANPDLPSDGRQRAAQSSALCSVPFSLLFCIASWGNESLAHRPRNSLWKSCGKLGGSGAAVRFSSLISG